MAGRDNRCIYESAVVCEEASVEARDLIGGSGGQRGITLSWAEYSRRGGGGGKREVGTNSEGVKQR